jgi:hypothetical protein
VKKHLDIATLVCLGLFQFQSQASVDVLMWHNDPSHTGQNLQETQLTLTNVNSGSFGQWFSYPVDGFVYAQPLYKANVSVPGKGVRNLLFVATEHDSIYAFDADDPQKDNGLPVWQVSIVDLTAGISSVPTIDMGISEPDELGITGTPVIDPDTGTLYVVVHTKEVSPGIINYPQRLHALDIATGAEKFGGPIQFSPQYPGSGNNTDGAGHVLFDDLHQLGRPGLLLINGVVYASFASGGDTGPYHGWVLGFDAQSLQLIQVFNDTPNGYQGGFWMSGASPAADLQGNIYLMSGNGDFDVSKSDFGDSFMKLTPSGTNLLLTDYFTPFNQAVLNSEDGDLGAGGPLILPDSVGSAQHPHLLVGCGKEGTIYLLDRDNMGHFNSTDDSQIVQTLPYVIHGTWGNPAYFNGLIYYQGQSDALKAFSISNGVMSTAPVLQNSQSVWTYPGGTPSISANGTNNAIVWLLQTDTFYQGAPAILHAYNATNLEEIYNSNQAGTRDQPGLAQKFSVPVIADGKVFVGGGFQLSVFGLLQAPAIVRPPASVAVSPGSMVTLTVSAAGPPPLVYQWQLGADPITGATNASLVLTNVSLGQSGPYLVQVTNAYGKVLSSGANVLAAAPPELSIDTDRQMLLTGRAGVSYQVEYLDRAPDLQTWQPLLHINLPGELSSDEPEQASFRDSAAPKNQRFYRALVLPPAPVPQ